MSFRASAAALKVAAPSASAKLVLVVLASFAGEDATCFPSQGRVAADAQLSLRAVRDSIRALETAGLIQTTPHSRPDGSRTTDLVRLTFPIPAAEPAHTSRRALPGDAVPGAGDGPVTEPKGGSEDPPQGARPLRGGLERLSGGGAADLLAAAGAGGLDGGAEGRGRPRLYAADRTRWGLSGAPLSFHNFYVTGRWVDCAEAASVQAPVRERFEGPAGLVAALRAGLGETGFASWTAGATWRETDRTLVARTRLAAATLRERCRSELRAHGARVDGPAGGAAPIRTPASSR
ncbi:MAG TPA: helix-turn-helix domain-containing protein [Caulobacteraceae bacterium]|jgi:hypothetical protein|nr:helix-turn-helix domain-containing protein [Caulobacteraceae bacterium]